MLRTILIILEVLVSVGLITTILMQSGRAAGISGAIAGGAQSLLGKRRGLMSSSARYLQGLPLRS